MFAKSEIIKENLSLHFFFCQFLLSEIFYMFKISLRRKRLKLQTNLKHKEQKRKNTYIYMKERKIIYFLLFSIIFVILLESCKIISNIFLRSYIYIFSKTTLIWIFQSHNLPAFDPAFIKFFILNFILCNLYTFIYF